MKTYIQDIKDMTDSREMLEAKPHSFLNWFVYILIAVIIAALAWAYFGEIEDYVKATGSVRPGDKISTIRNSVAGRVDKIYIDEGKRVRKGGILYTMELDEVLVEKKECESQIGRLEIENRNLIKYRQSINEGKNLFGNKNAGEADYYNRYKKYETDRLVNIEQYNNQKLDTAQLKKDAELSLKTAQGRLDKAEEDLNRQLLLERSIIEGKNLFAETEVEYFNRYNDYAINVEKLEITSRQAADAYARAIELYNDGAAARKELEEAKDLMNITLLDLNRFKNEYAMNLKASIEQSRQSIDEITASIKTVQSNLETLGSKGQDVDIMLEKMRLDTLVQIEDALAANENNLDKARTALKSLELNIEEATVKAPIDGIVNLYAEINTGDFLQSGVEIAAIVPDTAGEYKIQLMLTNEDVADVKQGQKIKYHFLALPYRVYGEAEGSVTKISTDARVDKESGMSYYIVEAALENHEMKSYKGDVKEIKVGMVCEAQVVTKSRKILRWLLEKINLVD